MAAVRSWTRLLRPTDLVERQVDGRWETLNDPAGFKVVETEGQPFQLVYRDLIEIPAPWRAIAHHLWMAEELGEEPIDLAALLDAGESSQPENAFSGENGGGGNRTRVTSQPETNAVQADRVSDAAGDPRPSLCNSGADA